QCSSLSSSSLSDSQKKPRFHPSSALPSERTHTFTTIYLPELSCTRSPRFTYPSYPVHVHHDLPTRFNLYTFTTIYLPELSCTRSPRFTYPSYPVHV
ncbi:heterogeneous nuclear ribonucleoprotein A0-like, partial [Arapaima gigas]